MGGIYGGDVTCGAGIIGSSTSATTLLNGQYSGRYAGYFDGDVRVTGTLYGYLLTPTLLSGSMEESESMSSHVVSSATDFADEWVSDKLRNIQLFRITYQNEDATSAIQRNVPTVSTVCDSLMAKQDRGEVLTDEEMEILENELNALEESALAMGIPQTKLSSTRYGLAADQMKNVYPELVYEDKNGNVSINYIEMVPLLVQSINELQSRIDDLEQDNASLRSELTGDEVTIKSRIDATSISVMDEATDIISLSQNDPNPFSDRTTITVNIPERVTTAAVFFYDMSGKQVDKRIITERGQSQLSITSSDMTEGMYLYSLIADGKVISTRKMILTK